MKIYIAQQNITVQIATSNGLRTTIMSGIPLYVADDRPITTVDIDD